MMRRAAISNGVNRGHQRRGTGHACCACGASRAGRRLLSFVFFVTCVATTTTLMLGFQFEYSESIDKHAALDATPIAINHRFPQHETSEYSQVCGWASPLDDVDKRRTANNQECIILVKQEDIGNEGIGHWISELTSGFLYHVQTGYRCRFYVEYTDGVNLTELLWPVPWDATHVEDGYIIDWRSPPGFNCTAESHCVRVNAYWKSRAEIEEAMEVPGIYPQHDQDSNDGKDLIVVPVPEFRHIWSSTDKPYASLIANIGGTFRTKNAMACSFSQLFHLAPTISRYKSNFLTELLPAVRDPTALVISLYVRTGRTDRVAKEEAKRRGWGEGREFGLQVEVRDKRGVHKLGPDHRRLADEENSKIGSIAEGIVKCALQAERNLLLLDNARVPSSRYKRVVWTVVGDDPSIIRAIRSRWNGTTMAQSSVGLGDESADNQIAATAILTRLVLTTSSAGTHVRPRRRPTTSEFAESLIDWYLLGESDAMATVTRQFSFGGTALLRNGARVQGIYAPPSQNSDECIRRDWRE